MEINKIIAKSRRYNKATTKVGSYKLAFTLIEIMAGVLIVTTVLIGGFQALSAITIGKAKLIQKVDVQKESFYFTEKLFEMVKKGGTLDYEEYFNRKVIGNTTYSSGHFSIPSGFGNYGSGGTVGNTGLPEYGDYHYFCTSGNGVGNKIINQGCFNNIYNIYGTDVLGKQQRYGQYSYQYVDYNANYDNDLGDEDGNGIIKGDDDDEYMGDGPEVFGPGVAIPELYLISGNKLERTLFRRTVDKDPYAPTAETCSVDNITNIITGSGCLGTVEYIKLLGKDLGKNHDKLGVTYLDGLIDTWIVDPDFTSGVDVIAGSKDVAWVPLFSDKIDVSEFSVTSFPNKDMALAWKNTEKSVNISPYTILKIKLKPSWITKRRIGGDGQVLDFSMTINLSEIYSQ